ncbi:VlmB-like protein [Streptomyces sp. AV19]|uniref:VlmB-like protein n=1 Tax=Streptomyces sp. AV19 TaxID=2793068 RepID=UPI0018FE6C8F|nr:VlmB-like protein [Streptomyces sp. AV19]MBH1933786.1 VlmB-like protein [Streptomyces sp. AV19]MDG4535710.1 VlmB-like protein [Streptomyces sp. AV19]
MTTSPVLPALPPEVDLRSAPRVLEGARDLDLTPERCNLTYWFENVAGGMLRQLRDGTIPDPGPTDAMLHPGPLRDALVTEFSFRHLAEVKATRALTQLVFHAPDDKCLEFFSTQLIDEARHARAFRDHLLRLGVPAGELTSTVERTAAADRAAVLDPLEDFGLTVVRGNGDFYGGVLVLTVLVEGVLAPAAELSERKWQPFDPAAALVERTANVDEIRHLTVGGAVIRRHVTEHPNEKGRLLEVIDRGRELWRELPMQEMLLKREALFQEGMSEHGALAEGYEVWQGRLLLDTTPEERLTVAENWSQETQQARMDHMLLGENAR